MKPLISFVRLIVYSNVFVSFCALALTHLTYILLKLPHNNCRGILVLVFCSTYFTYNYQRIIRLKNCNLLGKKIGVRLSWIVRNRSLLFTTSAVSGLITLVSLFYINIAIIYLLIPLAFLSIFYVFPVFPWQEKIVAVRNIPFVKIFIIALVWSFVTVALPYFNEYGFGKMLEPIFLQTLLKQFLFIFAITIPFDIRDLRFDLKAHIKTIPSYLGVKRSIYLAEILLIGYLLLTYFHYNYYHQISLQQFVSLCITVIITGVLITFSTKKRPELFFSGLVEGTMLLVYFGILILEYY